MKRGEEVKSKFSFFDLSLLIFKGSRGCGVDWRQKAAAQTKTGGKQPFLC